MAESSGMSFSKSEKEENSGFPKKLKQMSKLFVNMKLNEERNLEKMDLSELKEISKIPVSESKNKFCVAGKIISFLEKISVILVKPKLQSENEFLNIGTNLFLRSEDNWIVLGQIDEIFGNIKDPMYAVSLFPTDSHLFKMEDEIYFLVDDNTCLFHIERNNHSKYSVVYHN